MEKIINIHIKKLPDGIYLATSKDIQGLVAQGRTATEALEIASRKGTSVTYGHLKDTRLIDYPKKIKSPVFPFEFLYDLLRPAL